MRIQFASDLHLEFEMNELYLKEHPLSVIGDVLLLAGDIGCLNDENYLIHPFWDWASRNYKEVIVALGNHEFYNFYDLASLSDGYKGEIRYNVHYYYNAVVQIEDVDIIVSTLWAEIDIKNAFYIENVISDFKRIVYMDDLFSFSDFNREHRKCLKFIKKALVENRTNKKIVLTHHVPSFQMLSPMFINSRVNEAFVVELADFIEDSSIAYWIYGHSHRNIDCQIGNTKCITNQLGYVFMEEHLSFNQAKFIDI